MTLHLSPLSLLLAPLAGCVNRHQQEVIDYLMDEHRRFTEAGRPPMSSAAKALLDTRRS
jgi:hypothetical protein